MTHFREPGGRRGAAVLAALLTAAVLGGCVHGSAAPGAGSAPAPSHTAGGRQADSGRKPLPQLTEDQLLRIELAEQELIKRCMTKAGFRYWVTSDLTAEERRDPGYVLDDADWARKHGYGGRVARKVARARAQDPNSAYTEKLSRAAMGRYDRAMTGDRQHEGELTAELPGGGRIARPSGGCTSRAQHRLYGDLPAWFRVSTIADNLTPLYVEELKRDARFTAAVARWARCMKDRGHDYRDPEQLRARISSLTAGLSEKKAHRAEVRLALAEARCAERSSLGDTARELESAYRAKAAGNRYRSSLVQHRTMQHAALKRADALTRGD